GRRLRRDVRGGAYRRLPRLSRRPPLPALRAMGPAMARLSWLPVLGLILVWEAIARSGAFTAFVLPSARNVFQRMWADAASGELFTNLGLTLYRSLVGFLIASAIGIVLGLLMTRIRAVRWFFDPIISVGFQMPKIVFLPVVTLWLGFEDASK